MTTTVFGDFPFHEYRKESGDFFDTWVEARGEGFRDNQIWSVTEHENTIVYGPPQHYINLLGFVATKETHDGDTYYEEVIEMEDEDDDLLA